MNFFRKKLNKKDISDFELAKLMGEPISLTKPIVPFITLMSDKCLAYQWYNRIYLDEYPDQEKLRREYFNQFCNLKEITENVIRYTKAGITVKQFQERFLKKK